MKKTKEQNKGITLIALVITIIVMLILVGVTISMAVNGGLFEKAGEAAAKTNNAVEAEQALSNGAITVGGTYYGSIDEYINDINIAKVTITVISYDEQDNEISETFDFPAELSFAEAISRSPGKYSRWSTAEGYLILDGKTVTGFYKAGGRREKISSLKPEADALYVQEDEYTT